MEFMLLPYYEDYKQSRLPVNKCTSRLLMTFSLNHVNSIIVHLQRLGHPAISKGALLIERKWH